MDEKLLTQGEESVPVADDEWQAEVLRAQEEREHTLYAPQDVNERKSIVKLLVKGVLIGVFCLLLLFGWVYADNALLPFNSVAWKANTNRRTQIGRLRHQVQLVGLSNHQIIRLLGKPDKQSANELTYAWREHKGTGFLILAMKDDRVVNQRVAHY